MIKMDKPRILIIDDGAGICETLADIFQEKGYSIAIVNTGHEAANIVKTMLFDAALIGIDLPDIEGTALLRQLAKDYPWMACIIITANNSQNYAIEALKGGARGYFLKSLIAEEVLIRINEALYKQYLRRELEKSEERNRCIVRKK